jgi:hypothetical protein
MNAKTATDILKSAGVDASKAFGNDSLKNKQTFVAFRLIYDEHEKALAAPLKKTTKRKK